MTEINYVVSGSVQNHLIVYGKYSLRLNNLVPENLSKEQRDSVEISDEAVRQQNENMSLDKKLALHTSTRDSQFPTKTAYHGNTPC